LIFFFSIFYAYMIYKIFKYLLTNILITINKFKILNNRFKNKFL
jgi:hypothetical protein